MNSATLRTTVWMLAFGFWALTQSSLSGQTNSPIPKTRSTATRQSNADKTSLRPVPFRGTIKSVNGRAGSFVIGTRTFHLNSKAKLFRGERPTALHADLVGQWVTGSYQRTPDGKLSVISLYVGGKAMTTPRIAPPGPEEGRAQAKRAPRLPEGSVDAPPGVSPGK